MPDEAEESLRHTGRRRENVHREAGTREVGERYPVGGVQVVVALHIVDLVRGSGEAEGELAS